MNTKQLKKKLTIELNKIRDKINKIDMAERESENAALVGQCFKTRNNYSCPEKPEDYWWLYMRVLSTDGYGLNVATFQTDKDGNVRIEPSTYMASIFGERCLPDEFNSAWFAMLSNVNSHSSSIAAKP